MNLQILFSENSLADNSCWSSRHRTNKLVDTGKMLVLHFLFDFYDIMLVEAYCCFHKLTSEIGTNWLCIKENSTDCENRSTAACKEHYLLFELICFKFTFKRKSCNELKNLSCKNFCCSKALQIGLKSRKGSQKC